MLIMLHLFVLCVSWMASVEPSETLSTLSRYANPYLQAAHFAADEVPLAIATGGKEEQTLRLMVSDATFQKNRDMFAEPIAGGGADDRQQRFLRTIVVLTDSDQSSMIAELVQPMLPALESNEEIITVMREPTVISDAADDEASSPYQAKVIRDGDDFSLIQLRERRLTATAVKGDSVATGQP
jgi:hypothetical protein